MENDKLPYKGKHKDFYILLLLFYKVNNKVYMGLYKEIYREIYKENDIQLLYSM